MLNQHAWMHVIFKTETLYQEAEIVCTVAGVVGMVVRV
jgi:hypothetical protein